MKGEIIGYVVVEPDPAFIGDFNLMLGTPLFPADDRASAEGCLDGDAFIAEVRRSPSSTDEDLPE